MFILKSTHRAVVDQLKKEIELQSKFDNQTASYYKQLVGKLDSQIEDLRKLIFIPNQSRPEPVHLEADAVLMGSDKPATMSEEEYNKAFESSREVDLIFSGNYSEDLAQ